MECCEHFRLPENRKCPINWDVYIVFIGFLPLDFLCLSDQFIGFGELQGCQIDLTSYPFILESLCRRFLLVSSAVIYLLSSLSVEILTLIWNLYGKYVSSTAQKKAWMLLMGMVV